MEYHVSVLLEEAIESLQITPGEKYIDATLGGAGHTSQILQKGGSVLALDVDEDAVKNAELSIKNGQLRNQMKIVRGNFRDIRHIAEANGFSEVAGVLFDLGVSSYQFDTTEKGFSFQYEAPLDMRMDQSLSVTATDLVNGLRKDELIALFVRYGEEQYAKRIALAIVEERKKKRIETTKELAELIIRVYPKRTHPQPFRGGDAKKGIHPATKVFQALRIAVNDELHSLEEGLRGAVDLLKPGGRMVVISFHSLEDRIVKQSFLEFSKELKGRIITKKPVIPTYEEIEHNKRSRSAKMRIFEAA